MWPLEPDNATFRFKFEFKTDDLIVQTAIQNDKVVKEITLVRIKAAANTIHYQVLPLVLLR
jgi:hypothetical protein